jgi:divalent metal cation (Fe/Co/Zn/Cd) transporter
VRLLHFLWEFVVGGDPWAALAVVVAIAITAFTGFWWLLPLAVVGVLYVSLRRLT